MLDLLERLWKYLHIPWKTAIRFLLGASLGLLFTLSLPNDALLQDTTPLIQFTILGALLGYLLSRTRWKTFWCAVYTLIIVFVAAIQETGRILPANRYLQFWDWLTQLNWEFSLFMARFSGWMQSIVRFKAVQDPAWLTMLQVVQTLLIMGWFVWVYRRSGKLWLAVMPMLFMIGFYGYTGQAESMNFLLTLFCVVCLAAVHYYSVSEQSWKLQGLDYPDSLWQDWSVSVLIICALVLPVAYVAPSVTTPEGWQKIQSWYEEIQSSARENGTSGESEAWSGNTGSIYNNAHYLSGPDVSQVGVPLPQSDKVAMWVHTVDPTPRHWRAAIYSTYTGSGWIEAPLDEQSRDGTSESGQELSLGIKTVDQMFILSGSYNGSLFTPGDPVQSPTDGVQIVSVLPDGSTLLKGDVTRYEATSLVPNISANRLRISYADVPVEIAEVYLQIPESLPGRVNLLARKLVVGKTNQLDQVLAVQDYLRNTIPYDLNTPQPDAGQDVVDYFLFEAPSGFCTYYASSMAVMLRTIGIPARVVTGYAAGTYLMQQGMFQVPGNAAHAWVEVYFGEYGWIPFEPTPSYEIPFYARAQEVITPPQVIPQQQAARQLFWLRSGGMVLGSTLLMGIFIVLWRVWQTRRSIARRTHHPLARMYLLLRYRLQDAGLTIQVTQTPREFLRTAAEPLADYPRIWDVLQNNTALMEQALFSPHAPLAQQEKALRASLRASWPEWVKMGWRRVVNRVRMRFGSR
jgi:hypothetical protein